MEIQIISQIHPQTYESPYMNATEFNGSVQFAFCKITEFGGCFSPTICVLSCTCSIRGWSTPSPFSLDVPQSPTLDQR